MTHPPTVTSRPYDDDVTNIIYELLFCDKISLYKSDTSTSFDYPWNILFATAPDPIALQKLVFDDHVESGIKLVAYDVNDELAAPALYSCTALMQYLTEKVEKTQI